MNVIKKNLFFSFIVVYINNREIVKVTQRGKRPFVYRWWNLNMAKPKWLICTLPSSARWSLPSHTGDCWQRGDDLMCSLTVWGHVIGLMMYFSFAECVQIEIEIMNATVEWWWQFWRQWQWGCRDEIISCWNYCSSIH